MSNQRVVISGAGVVSAIGLDLQQTLDALQKGVSGIGPVRLLDTVHREFPVGEVALSNEQLREQLQIDGDTLISRNSLLGIMAAREAMAQAGIGQEGKNATTALICGTTVGGMDLTEQYYPDRLNAEVLRRHGCGDSTEQIALHTGGFNFTTTVSTACSAALNAIILGKRLIESGQYDIVVAGGMESLTRFHLNGFKSLMILDEHPCRPFDADRHGLNLGEGAAFIVIETEEHALQRGATPLAVIEGAANACDAYHQTASSPDGEGAYRAMTEALGEAALQPDDIDYVNAHGTATPDNDAAESAALQRVFGDKMPPVSSTKSFTGHTTSASGAIETVFSILALRHQFIPVNLGWQHPDEACINPYLGKDGNNSHLLRHVLCNAFGFGGNDSAVVLGKYEPSTQERPENPKYSENRQVYVVAEVKEVAETEYREYLNPMKARRYGRLLRRALVTALKAIRESGIDHPDAIINGTALGCISNTEQMLDTLHTEGESASMPTCFMQSTHNTVASLIAIHTGNHGYNSTYSHGEQSFECALQDAYLQIKSGRIHSALVCANDELTDSLREKTTQCGLQPGQHADRSWALMLSADPGNIKTHPDTHKGRE